jgi:hypothetical protein
MRCDAIIELEVIMGKPAARVTDMVAHPLPPVLTEPGSKTVLINNLPACLPDGRYRAGSYWPPQQDHYGDDDGFDW